MVLSIIYLDRKKAEEKLEFFRIQIKMERIHNNCRPGPYNPDPNPLLSLINLSISAPEQDLCDDSAPHSTYSSTTTQRYKKKCKNKFHSSKM